MTKLVNRAKMTTATTGTGTITLGSAVDGYQTFADAGVANGNIVRYVIEDGSAWEIGLGTYSTTGTTLTRGSIESSNADNPINLTGNAVVYVSAAAADLQELVDFADNFVLPTADGSTGQVLTTNGAGTLSFTTIAGYTNADVDAHLNTSTAASGEVLSWNGSDYDWITSGGAFSVVGTNNLKAIATLPALTTGTNNFAAGSTAGNALTSGSHNVAIGEEALFSTTTNSASVAIGRSAGRNGNQNGAISIGDNAGLAGAFRGVALGYYAGYFNTGSQRIAIGPNALNGVSGTSTGADNIGIGNSAGRDLTTGATNILIGSLSGENLTTGSNNVAIGNGALDAATTGGRNIAIGQDAMGLGVATAASGDNIAIGYQAGYDITSGTDNILVGDRAGSNITTGYDNVAIGKDALFFAATTTFGNVSVGASAGGESNSLYGVNIGTEAGYNNQGAYNIGVGYQALRGSPTSKLTGARNVGIGDRVGIDLTTGANNFLAGYLAGTDLTTGSNNVAIGNGALDAATTGGGNIAIGHEAMGNGVATEANGFNIAIGRLAGNNITTGMFNVAVGTSALANLLTTGSNNTAFGTDAGRLCSGGNNTFVGFGAGEDTTTGTNQVVLGYAAEASSATVSNEITLGNASITTLRCQVTTITSLSDARDKTDIQPLNAGLEFVEALNPVSFTWNMRDGGKVGIADTGFIAQDLQMAQEWAGVTIPGLVYDVNPDKLEAGYGKLIPVLVQAIKDLSAKVNLLEAQLEAQK